MIKASIDHTRLPVENPVGKFLKIYLYRLLLIITIAIASLALLLLLTFSISPNFRRSIFLSQPLAVIMPSDSSRSLDAETAILILRAEMQAELRRIEKEVEQTNSNAEIEAFLAQQQLQLRLEQQSRQSFVSIKNIGLLVLMLVALMTICLFAFGMVLYGRARAKIRIDFQRAVANQEHGA